MKLTPLNIVTSGCLVMGVFSGMTGLYILGAIIAFISDLIFRKFIPLTRNLWVVEGAFLIFSLVLMIIFKMAIG
ncbi:hypothetical protein [Pedobacter antarcticus]|uniref:hypothetical protein n=1 Tax=Pedobacter antarcticus TaxID=34086 RepID=UPI00292D6C49|nr:hypothetical protein [Pedobacter antarcticus]